jgi:hypothetical protein
MTGEDGGWIIIVILEGGSRLISREAESDTAEEGAVCCRVAFSD